MDIRCLIEYVEKWLELSLAFLVTAPVTVAVDGGMVTVPISEQPLRLNIRYIVQNVIST